MNNLQPAVSAARAAAPPTATTTTPGRGRVRCVLIGTLCGLLGAGAALAQKAADTVKVALNEPIRTLVQAEEPRPESELFTQAVFDGLVCFDTAKRQYRPQLAESWTTPDDRTTVFKLRRDVKWHDGKPFNADDVVYTLNYYVNPASKLFIVATEARWLDKVEKLDDHTVKVTSKTPSPMVLGFFAWNGQILPRSHGELADRASFGRRTPVGTGPYKVVSIDANKGVVLVRNDAYFGKPGDCRGPAKIKNIQGISIPDAQTQIAQVMTGGVQLARSSSKDEVEMLSALPAFKATSIPSLQFYFLGIDVAGRSSQKALGDLRVRQAIAQAIDRDEIGRTMVAGAKDVKALAAFCTEASIGCFSTSKLPRHDLAAARALLTQAGHANGFDLELAALPGAGKVAEAVAGQLRRVGIRASVQNLPFSVYRQAQTDGKLQMTVSIQGQPDATGPAQLSMDGGPRDYIRDPALTALLAQSLTTAEPAARQAVNTKMFNLINDKLYVLPLVSKPDIFVHPADLVVPGVTGRPGTSLEALSWR